jgi:hypothetical protein
MISNTTVRSHSREATLLLNEAIKNNPSIANQYNERQLQQISEGIKPTGYTWHHHQEEGVLQLVDSTVHGRTGHTGGQTIWTGENKNR